MGMINIPESLMESLTTHALEAARVSIEKSIVHAIDSEVSGHTGSVRKYVQANLVKSLNPMIEARMGEVQAAATKIMDRIFRELDATILTAVNLRISHAVADFSKKLADSAASALTSAMTARASDIENEIEANRRARIAANRPPALPAPPAAVTDDPATRRYSNLDLD